MPAVQVVLTKLHAGGKFDASLIKSPAACTRRRQLRERPSQEFNVEIWRDNHTWEDGLQLRRSRRRLRQAGPSQKSAELKFIFAGQEQKNFRYRSQL